MPTHIELSTTEPISLRSGAKRPSAVCVLFCHAGESEILLMKRSTTVETHRGQIGLPGGRLEESDTSFAAAALRELEEEVGISASHGILIHGYGKEARALDGSTVIPVICSVSQKPELKICPDEVECCHWVPWDMFADGQAQKFTFCIFGVRRETLVFPAGGLQVWGLTAKIISTLSES